MDSSFNYEKSITRLEEIVGLLEGGELPLEESMKLLEEGTRLSAVCYEALNSAEQRLTTISLTDSDKED